MASTQSFGDQNHGLQVGTNHAPITAQYYLPPEIPETPVSPLSTVPFHLDPDFVERSFLLNEIHEKCSNPASRIALVGLGGIGKSKLAIEYSYRIRIKSPQTWVFWVHASNTIRIERSFQEIANRVKIPGRQDPRSNIFNLVSNWLQDDTTGPWIMIVDNVDDDCLHEPPPVPLERIENEHMVTLRQPILTFLPRVPKGSIIFTTRRKGVALKVVDERDLILVGPMDKPHALALMEKKLGIPTEDECTIKLIEALEFMPLAIVQAAAYIRHRAPRCSVSQYLKDFWESDRKRMKLLDYDTGHFHRDWDANNSIMITWQLSFDHIQQIRKSAADLLSLMSFFDRQGIPENLLRTPSPSTDNKTDPSDILGSLDWIDHDSEAEYDAFDNFEDDVAILREYSFISVVDQGSVFEMHALVQLATRKWLAANGEIEQWKRRFIDILLDKFPSGEYKNWTECQWIFPHIRSAASQRPKSGNDLREWASLLHEGARYAWRRGNTADMKRMATMATAARNNVLGLEHEDSLNSAGIVGLTYMLEGRWHQAEKLWANLRQNCERVLGMEHHSTLTSMSNLALTFWNQGRWQEAESVGSQVLETRQRILGSEHPETLTSMENLAATFMSQGRWYMAENLCLQVLESRRKVLGPGHPDTLNSMANLASMSQKHGRWPEAEKMGFLVLETQRETLGAEHPDTLSSMGNLASTIRDQDRLQEAEALDIQALEIANRVLGAEHPDIRYPMANLAATYMRQGRLHEAETLQAQVLDICARLFSKYHPDMLTSMSNLALTLRHQGQLEKAEKLETEVLEMRKRVLGFEHPDTLAAMANLANTLWSSDRKAAAFSLMAECAHLRQRILGPDHPHTVSVSSTLQHWDGA